MNNSNVKRNYFIYVVLNVLGLYCCAKASPVVASGGYTLVVVLRLLIVGASLVAESGFEAGSAFSSCGSWGIECRLSSCGSGASLLLGTWNLLRSGIEPVSPALAGSVLSALPPGKSVNNRNLSCVILEARSPRSRCWQIW